MKMVEKIVRLVEEHPLSAREIERRSGLSQGRISKWKEHPDKARPSIRQMLLMSRVLGVPLDWLVDDAAPEVPPPVLQSLSADELAVLDAARELGSFVRACDLIRQRGQVFVAGPGQPKNFPPTSQSKGEGSARRKPGA